MPIPKSDCQCASEWNVNELVCPRIVVTPRYIFAARAAKPAPRSGAQSARHGPVTSRPSLGGAYEERRNCLNLISLVLALVVIVSRCMELDHYARYSQINNTTFGIIAVYGFFGISGYLIAGSAERNGAGRCLWQRCLRILPGFRV